MVQFARATIAQVPPEQDPAYEYIHPSKPGYSSDWGHNAFDLPTNGMKRLYATYCQGHFSVKFDGRELADCQCVCMDIAALAYVAFFGEDLPPRQWTVDDLYRIMFHGNEYYATTLDYVTQELNQIERLRESEYFLAASQIKARASLFGNDVIVQTGQVFYGYILRGERKFGGLIHDLTTFFEQGDKAIIISRRRARGIFSAEGKFYIYDPHAVKPHDAAVLIENDSIEELFNNLKELIKGEHQTDAELTLQMYDLIPVSVELVPEGAFENGQAEYGINGQSHSPIIEEIKYSELMQHQAEDEGLDDDGGEGVIEEVHPAEVAHPVAATYFPCNFEADCTAIFTDPTMLQRHLLVEHLHEKRPYLCLFPGCNFDSSRSDYVRDHVYSKHRLDERFPPPVPESKFDPTNFRFVSLKLHLLHGHNIYFENGLEEEEVTENQVAMNMNQMASSSLQQNSTVATVTSQTSAEESVADTGEAENSQVASSSGDANQALSTGTLPTNKRQRSPSKKATSSTVDSVIEEVLKQVATSAETPAPTKRGRKKKETAEQPQQKPPRKRQRKEPTKVAAENVEVTHQAEDDQMNNAIDTTSQVPAADKPLTKKRQRKMPAKLATQSIVDPRVQKALGHSTTPAEAPTKVATSSSSRAASKPFRCELVPDCKKSFSDETRLLHHHLAVHLEVPRPYMCRFPGCTFDAQRPDYVRDHVFKHSKDERFPPPVPKLKSDPNNLRFVGLKLHLLPKQGDASVLVDPTITSPASKSHAASNNQLASGGEASTSAVDVQVQVPTKMKRSRKRPAKLAAEESVAGTQEAEKSQATNSTGDANQALTTGTLPTNKRKRSPSKKTLSTVDSVIEEVVANSTEAPAPKKRGRPPKKQQQMEPIKVTTENVDVTHQAEDGEVGNSADSTNQVPAAEKPLTKKRQRKLPAKLATRSIIDPRVQKVLGHSTTSAEAPVKVSSKPFRCELVSDCKKSFSDETRLLHHHLAVHLEVPRPYMCRFPGCTFDAQRPDYVRDHVFKHSTDERFPPPVPKSKFDPNNFRFVGLKLHLLPKQGDASVLVNPTITSPATETRQKSSSKLHGVANDQLASGGEASTSAVDVQVQVPTKVKRSRKRPAKLAAEESVAGTQEAEKSQVASSTGDPNQPQVEENLSTKKRQRSPSKKATSSTIDSVIEEVVKQVATSTEAPAPTKRGRKRKDTAEQPQQKPPRKRQRKEPTKVATENVEVAHQVEDGQMNNAIASTSQVPAADKPLTKQRQRKLPPKLATQSISSAEAPVKAVASSLRATPAASEQFRCELVPDCKKSFPDETRLLHHHLAVHLEEPRPYMCRFPGCTFDSPRSDHVRDHVYSHRRDERFPPPVPESRSDPNNFRFVGLKLHLLQGRDESASQANTSAENPVKKTSTSPVIRARKSLPSKPTVETNGHVLSGEQQQALTSAAASTANATHVLAKKKQT